MADALQASSDGVELVPSFCNAPERRHQGYAILSRNQSSLSSAKGVNEFLSFPSYTPINAEAEKLSSISQASLTNLVEAENIYGSELVTTFCNARTFRNARARWRLAYAILKSTWALRSLAKGKLTTRVSRSQSYTLINVESDCLPTIDQSSLSNLVEAKNIDLLHHFGGVEGLISALGTDADKGIQGSDENIAIRRKYSGSNTNQKPPTKALQVVLEAIKDPIILILIVCATLSVCFGTKKYGMKGWSNGGSILVAVLLFVTASAFSNLWCRSHFHKLCRASDSKNTLVDVVRNGKTEHISVFNVVVGDIVHLKIGNQVPADGLVIEGHSLWVDESILTGGSDLVEVNSSNNPFLISGTKVADGCARMLVTSVGMNTEWGRKMSLRSHNYNEKTPLQAELNKLTLFVSMIGLMAAALVLVVLLVRYFTGSMHNDHGKPESSGGRTNIHHVFNAVIGILATSVTIAAAAIPDGLLLAAAITLAYSTKRLASDQVLVRDLPAYEAIGSATVICTNKRGILTSNYIKVNKFCLGNKEVNGGGSSEIAQNVQELLCLQGLGIKRHEASSEPVREKSKNQIERAIYDWVVQEMSMDIAELRERYTILHVEALDSEKTKGSILIKKISDDTIHLHKKGAPDVILATCKHYFEDSGIIKVINQGTREKLEHKIQEMTDNGLVCIALAHKQKVKDNYDGDFDLKLEEESFTLLGFVGLKDPCRPEVKEAVIDCHRAGVNIQMITRDDVLTARASAIECGIIEPNQVINTKEVIQGVEFENYTPEERIEKVDKIRVIARASTFHKTLIIRCLKQKCHVVAVTGESKGDVLALKEADIGLSLGIQGTDIVKENSDIVILDDNFVSVARVLRWGRGMYNNIQIFAQFQLTVSIASLVIDFVIAISADEPPTFNIVAAISAGEVPFATLQILWVKLIVGTLASLALTIEKPNEELMEQPPRDRREPFITNIMWRNIVAQALYQIVVLLTIQFKGESIFKVNAKVKDTLIFNTFVLCHIFTIFNTRRFEKNIFKGLQRKKLFWGIIGLIILLQLLMVEFLKRFADTERLNWGQWGSCFGIAVVSWPIGWLVKCIPVPKKPFSSYIKGHNYLSMA